MIKISSRKNISVIYYYSDEDFKEIIKRNYTYSDCLREFGLSTSGSASRIILKRRIAELNLDISHFDPYKNSSTETAKSKNKIDYYSTESIKSVFIKNSNQYTSRVKKIILTNNLLEYKCSNCGNTGEWNGKKLTLQLDHINGDHNDNRLENLRFLCPNCHTQTETYGGKKTKKQSQFKRCKCCQKKFIPKNKRQQFCNQDCFKKYSRKVKWPTKEELDNLLKEYKHNICAIARLFNVSDNAINHWIKYYQKQK